MTEGEWGDGPALSGHLDAICCPHCHIALDSEATCPECGQMQLPDCSMGT